MDKTEIKQLLWYGHLKRIEEDRWPKKALQYVPQNRKRKERTITTWTEEIIKIMRNRTIYEDDRKIRKNKGRFFKLIDTF